MLSKLYYISQGNTQQEHLKNINKACIAGVKLIQLRLKNIPDEEILKTAKEARDITYKYQVKLIINDYYNIAKEIQADGVHLGKEDASPTNVRAFLGENFIIGGTANTSKDCLTLIQQNVDYIGLGPFRFTKTKDNLSPILGYEGYQSIVKTLRTEIPIIAIGGITIEDVNELLKTGIYGIAISGEITKNFDYVRVLNKLLHAPAVKLRRGI